MSEILIVCDLDGTLLNDKKEITKRTVVTLKEAKKNNCRVCFASGRGEKMMSIYSDSIGECDYLVSCNGAMARYLPENELLYVAVLNDADAKAVLEYIFEHRLSFMMYTVDRIFYSEFGREMRSRVISYERKAEMLGYPVCLPAGPLEESDWRNMKLDQIVKIVIYEEDQAVMDQYVQFVNENLPETGCETTGYGLMGTFSRNVSKKYAVERIKEHMGIKSDRVYVFGDYDNDLSMFVCADHRIAMENASDSVKKMSTFVTSTNNEDGVAEYIERKIIKNVSK